MGNRAGRGAAEPRRKALHQITNGGVDSPFTVRTGFSTVAVQKGRGAPICAQGTALNYQRAYCKTTRNDTPHLNPP